MEVILSKANSLRDRCILSLLFDSGLRVSEVCSIKSDGIDWSSSTLKVVVKGNREARAVFTPRTATLLKDYLSSNGHNPTLFDIKPSSIQTMLKRLNKDTGMACNPHSFRCGFACNLHRKGLSTLDIMHLGRWKSLPMVVKYTRRITFEDCLEHYKAALTS